MTPKQQGIAAVAMVPFYAFLAFRVAHIQPQQTVFGASTDFVAGLLIGLAIALLISSLGRLSGFNDAPDA